MRLGKWVLGLMGIAVLSFFLGGSAQAQGTPGMPNCEIFPYTPNELCLHNGVEYYTNGPYHKWSQGNRGAGNYFPSFTHQAGQGGPSFQCQYMWKIDGWCWYGMMGNNAISTWYWETMLIFSRDNAYSLNMSWDYPKVFCDGLTTHYSFCSPIFGAVINSGVPVVGGKGLVLPSSAGGTYNQNIFFICAGYVTVPGTSPFTCYSFNCMFGDCMYPATVPSSDSIYAFVYTHDNPRNPDQYVCLDGDCPDCIGNGGNKGRNYTIISDYDNGYYWMWLNGCTGTNTDWGICLLVCDVVTIPVNIPGDPENPYAAFGFDLGPATVTPYASSGCVALQWCTLANNGSACGYTRIILGNLGLGPCQTYNPFCCYRITFWDLVSEITASIAPLTAHTPLPGYPATCLGTCCGGHTLVPLPLLPDPALFCLEIWWYSFQPFLAGVQPAGPPSAHFMADRKSVV